MQVVHISSVLLALENTKSELKYLVDHLEITAKHSNSPSVNFDLKLAKDLHSFTQKRIDIIKDLAFEAKEDFAASLEIA